MAVQADTGLSWNHPSCHNSANKPSSYSTPHHMSHLQAQRESRPDLVTPHSRYDEARKGW